MAGFRHRDKVTVVDVAVVEIVPTRPVVRLLWLPAQGLRPLRAFVEHALQATTDDAAFRAPTRTLVGCPPVVLLAERTA